MQNQVKGSARSSKPLCRNRGTRNFVDGRGKEISAETRRCRTNTTHRKPTGQADPKKALHKQNLFLRLLAGPVKREESIRKFGMRAKYYCGGKEAEKVLRGGGRCPKGRKESGAGDNIPYWNEGVK